MDNSDQNKKSGPGSTTPPSPYAPQHQGMSDCGDFPHFDKTGSATELVPMEIAVQSEATSPTPRPMSISMKAPPPTPQSEGQTENYQSDIFQKPPKFLLYPTVAVPVTNLNPESGAFKDGSPQGQQQQQIDQIKATGLGQNQLRAPTVFTVTNNPQAMQRQLDMTPQEGPFPVDEYMPRRSHRAICPYCRIPVITETEFVSGTATHIVALALFWMSCCCCVAYYFDELKDVEHFCPQCNNVLGYFRKTLC